MAKDMQAILEQARGALDSAGVSYSPTATLNELVGLLRNEHIASRTLTDEERQEEFDQREADVLSGMNNESYYSYQDPERVYLDEEDSQGKENLNRDESVFGEVKEGLRLQGMLEGAGLTKYVASYMKTPHYLEMLGQASKNTVDYYNHYGIPTEYDEKSLRIETGQAWGEARNAFHDGVIREVPKDVQDKLGMLVASSTRNRDVTGHDIEDANNYYRSATGYDDKGNIIKRGQFQTFAERELEGHKEARKLFTELARSQTPEGKAYEERVQVRAQLIQKEYGQKARELARSNATAERALVKGRDGKPQRTAITGEGKNAYLGSVVQNLYGYDVTKKDFGEERWDHASKVLKQYNKIIGIGQDQEFKKKQLGLVGEKPMHVSEGDEKRYERNRLEVLTDGPVDSVFVPSDSADSTVRIQGTEIKIDQSSEESTFSTRRARVKELRAQAKRRAQTPEQALKKEAPPVLLPPEEVEERRLVRVAEREARKEAGRPTPVEVPRVSPQDAVGSGEFVGPLARSNADVDAEYRAKHPVSIPPPIASVAAEQETGFKVTRGRPNTSLGNLMQDSFVGPIRPNMAMEEWGNISKPNPLKDVDANSSVSGDPIASSLVVGHTAPSDVKLIEPVPSTPYLGGGSNEEPPINMDEASQTLQDLDDHARAVRISRGTLTPTTEESPEVIQAAHNMTETRLKQEERFLQGQMSEDLSDLIEYSENRQNTDAWKYQDRAGKITASAAGSILEGGKSREQALDNIAYNTLASAPFAGPSTSKQLAEVRRKNQARLQGPDRFKLRSTGETDFEAGHRLEDVAKGALAEKYGSISNAGFVTRQSMEGLGASPDGIFDVGDGLLEIKAPREFKPLSQEYREQMQLQMHVLDKQHMTFAQIVEDEEGNTQIRETRLDRNEDWYTDNKDKIEKARDDLAERISSNAPEDLSHLSDTQREVVREARERTEANQTAAEEAHYDKAGRRGRARAKASARAKGEGTTSGVVRTDEAYEEGQEEETRYNLLRRKSELRSRQAARRAGRGRRSGVVGTDEAYQARVDAEDEAGYIKDQHEHNLVAQAIEAREAKERERTQQGKEAVQGAVQRAKVDEDRRSKEEKEEAKLQKQVNTAFLTALNSGSLGRTGEGMLGALAQTGGPIARTIAGAGSGIVAGLGLAQDIAQTVSGFADMGMRYNRDIYQVEGNNLALQRGGMSAPGSRAMQNTLLHAQSELSIGDARAAAKITKDTQGQISIEDIRDYGHSPIALLRNLVDRNEISGEKSQTELMALANRIHPEGGKIVSYIMEGDVEKLEELAERTGDSEALKEGVRSTNDQQTSFFGLPGLTHRATEWLADRAGDLSEHAGTSLTAATLGVGATSAVVGTVGLYGTAKGAKNLYNKVTGPKSAPASAPSPTSTPKPNVAPRTTSTGAGMLTRAGSALGRLNAAGAVATAGYAIGQWGVDFANNIDADFFGGELNERNTARQEAWKHLVGHEEEAPDTSTLSDLDKEYMEYVANKRIGEDEDWIEKTAGSVSSKELAKQTHQNMQQKVVVDVNLNIDNKAISAEVAVDGEMKQQQVTSNQVGQTF